MYPGPVNDQISSTNFLLRPDCSSDSSGNISKLSEESEQESEKEDDNPLKNWKKAIKFISQQDELDQKEELVLRSQVLAGESLVVGAADN